MTSKPLTELADSIVAWIDRLQPLLLVTHLRPDGDAIGSLFGAYLALREHGIACDAYMGDEVPSNWEAFVPAGAIMGGPVEASRYKGLLCLDCANPSRLGLPPNLDHHDLPFPACNLDHHVDNKRYGEVNLVDGTYAATAELLAEFFAATDLPISPRCATLLLMGILTDTGGFKHANTDGRVLRVAADLIDRKGDYQDIVRAAFYSETPELVKLKGYLTEHLRFAHDRRLVYFVLTPEMLTEFGVDERDTEDLIDVARTMRGIELICRMQLVEDGVRFSFRSQNPDLPVNGIAHKLNGGGHAMAAGAKMTGIDLEEAEALLLEYTGELLDGQ